MHVVRERLSICVCASFPFGFESGVCALIVLNPDYFLSFNSLLYYKEVEKDQKGDHLFGKLLFTWLSLVVSMVMFFCAVLFPTRCLG